MKNISLIIVTLLISLGLPGCHHAVPHPPSYSDIVEATKDCGAEDSILCDRSLELTSALQFDERDLIAIQESNDARLMLGAGIQSPVGSDLGTKLLRFAYDKEKPAGVAAISLIRNHLSDVANNNLSRNALSVGEFSDVIERLKREDSTNAASYYLTALLRYQIHEEATAIKLLHDGNETNRYDSYAKERFYAVVDAATYRGYSRFAAQYFALGNLVPVSIYSSLRKMCADLIAHIPEGQARLECRRMGEKIEWSTGSILEKLMGISIQTTALKGSSEPSSDKMLLDIMQRKSSLSEPVGECRGRLMSEDMYGEYYRIFFEKGEVEALRFEELINKRQDRPQN